MVPVVKFISVSDEICCQIKMDHGVLPCQVQSSLYLSSTSSLCFVCSEETFNAARDAWDVLDFDCLRYCTVVIVVYCRKISLLYTSRTVP